MVTFVHLQALDPNGDGSESWGHLEVDGSRLEVDALCRCAGQGFVWIAPRDLASWTRTARFAARRDAPRCDAYGHAETTEHVALPVEVPVGVVLALEPQIDADAPVGTRYLIRFGDGAAESTILAPESEPDALPVRLGGRFEDLAAWLRSPDVLIGHHLVGGTFTLEGDIGGAALVEAWSWYRATALGGHESDVLGGRPAG